MTKWSNLGNKYSTSTLTFEVVCLGFGVAQSSESFYFPAILEDLT